jgi:hypothetical protein
VKRRRDNHEVLCLFVRRRESCDCDKQQRTRASNVKTREVTMQ